MIAPLDLDELETLVRAGIFLPWRYEIPQKNVRIRASNGDFVMESGPHYVRREQEAQLIVAAVNALPALIAELRAARRDAALGKIALRFIDRLADPDDNCDPWSRSVPEFERAMDEEINRQRAAIAKGGPT